MAFRVGRAAVVVVVNADALVFPERLATHPTREALGLQESVEVSLGDAEPDELVRPVPPRLSFWRVVADASATADPVVLHGLGSRAGRGVASTTGTVRLLARHPFTAQLLSYVGRAGIEPAAFRV